MLPDVKSSMGGESEGDVPSSSSMVVPADVKTSDEDDSSGRNTGLADHSELSLLECDIAINHESLLLIKILESSESVDVMHTYN